MSGPQPAVICRTPATRTRRRSSASVTSPASRSNGRSRRAATCPLRRRSTAKTVFVPDWAGNLFAVDWKTGQEVWRAQHPGRQRRAGRQGPCDPGHHRQQGDRRHAGSVRRRRTKMLAFDKNTGALLWSTTIESHFAAIVTQSAVVARRAALYVGCRRWRRAWPPSSRATSAARSGAAWRPST